MFAYHGLYPEEKVLGNQFIIHCKVGIEHKRIESINDTIDYALLLEIVKKHFAIPVPLLETLAEKIEQESKEIFPAIKYFFISIKKMNPALSAQLQSSEIMIEKNY